MTGFRCNRCEDKGWRFDDDPCLDFGGPTNYEIVCECHAHKPRDELICLIVAVRTNNRIL